MSTRHEITLDKLDFKIISLLITVQDNKQIASELKIPLSTIQRRTKNIMDNGIVSVRIEPNYKKLGIKRGLLHVYLRNGDIKETAMNVSKMDGILSTSVHVGNSDIVADYVYEDTEQLIDVISNIKHMDNVERVLWSEEVYSVPTNLANIVKSFKNMWNTNGNSNGNGNGNNNGNGNSGNRIIKA